MANCKYLLFAPDVAEQFHSTSSLTRYFDIWRSRYLRARQMAQFAELVTRKGKVARERRAFVCWKLCIYLYVWCVGGWCVYGVYYVCGMCGLCTCM